MLKKEGKINHVVIENMISWRHTGFHVHIGARIRPEDEIAYGNLDSNKSRGMRKKEEIDIIVPSIAPGELTSKKFRRNRERLIQKTSEVDPLCCPNYRHQMRVISILGAGHIVKKILEHLDLWDFLNNNLPDKKESHINELVYDDSDSPGYKGFGGSKKSIWQFKRSRSQAPPGNA